jgi:hypothetical protein
MGKEWKIRHRYFRQWTEWKKRHRDFRQWAKSERKDIVSLFAHCLKYLCLFFHTLPIVWSIYVFSFILCPLSEVSMSFLSLFAHCLMYLCLFFHSAHCLKYLCLFSHSLPIVWSIYVFYFTLCPLSEVSMSFLSKCAEWKKRHRYSRQWAKSERKDIDTSDNGQRVKEKT